MDIFLKALAGLAGRYSGQSCHLHLRDSMNQQEDRIMRRGQIFALKSDSNRKHNTTLKQYLSKRLVLISNYIHIHTVLLISHSQYITLAVMSFTV